MYNKFGNMVMAVWPSILIFIIGWISLLSGGNLTGITIVLMFVGAGLVVISFAIICYTASMYLHLTNIMDESTVSSFIDKRYIKEITFLGRVVVYYSARALGYQQIVDTKLTEHGYKWYNVLLR